MEQDNNNKSSSKNNNIKNLTKQFTNTSLNEGQSFEIKIKENDDILNSISDISKKEEEGDSTQYINTSINEGHSFSILIKKDKKNDNSILNNTFEESKTLNNNITILTEAPKNERQYWIDALRILASYMVILVHSSSYAIESVPLFTSQWEGLMFWNSMSRSCVPLFIMISGSLFLNPRKKIPISKLYKKYIFRIVKILIVWNIFYCTINKYLVNCFNVKYQWDINIIKEFFSDLIYGKFHMWYLYMCIGLYMVTPVFRVLVKDIEVMKYFLILALLLVQIIPFICQIINKFYSNTYTIYVTDLIGKLMFYSIYGYSFYFISGYFLSQVTINNQVILIFIYFLGLISMIFTFFIKLIVCNINKQEVTDFDDYNSFNVCITTISIFIFFKHFGKKTLDKLMTKPIFKKLLLELSNVSFGIYLIHVFYFELFRKLTFNSYTFNTLIFTPLHALCIWIYSGITIYVLKKIPFIRDFM